MSFSAVCRVKLSVLCLLVGLVASSEPCQRCLGTRLFGVTVPLLFSGDRLVQGSCPLSGPAQPGWILSLMVKTWLYP